MPYLINRYSGSQLSLIVDGTVDQSTSLKLVGKNYVGYGEIQNENFVYLLENFSSPTAPNKPISGQLWFNNFKKTISVYNGTSWEQLGAVEISNQQPSNMENGSFWFDTSTQQTFIKVEDSYRLIGPEAIKNFGITRAVSETVKDSEGNDNPVIKVVIDDTVIAIVTKTSFTISNETPIDGFNLLAAGITLCNQFELKGIAESARKLTTPAKINNVNFDGSQDITVTVAGSALTGNSLATGIVNSSLTSVGTLTNLTVTNTINGNISGNSGTTNKLLNSVKINNVDFDGSSNITVADSTKVPLSGGNMTGPLVLSGLPSIGGHAANKDYVDAQVASISVVPQGLICMWSGAVNNIPGGWALCNGSNGTPNLSDRFVVGAGSAYTVGSTGGSKDAVIVDHAHTASFSGDALSNHNHAVTDPGHSHAVTSSGVRHGRDGRNPGTNFFASDGDSATTASRPSLNSSTSNTEISISPASAGTPSGEVTVNNTGVSGVNKNLPPYYALAYIMKL